MIGNLPVYIPLTFGLTTFATLLLFIWCIRNAAAEPTRKKAIPVFTGLAIWLLLQGALAFKNVYNIDIHTFPPKIMLVGIFPAILTIILLFSTSQGRRFIDNLPLMHLTYLNIVRIPVEMVLFWLMLHKAVPVLMTFEGRNFDIIAGITAPFIAYFGITKKKIKRKVIVAWNITSLGLLINIVTNALFAAPSPIQKFAFEQPNIAILNFPFAWLPTFIVPVVLLGHLASIRQLLKRSGH